MARRIPKRRKCRSCWRNFAPGDLVTERPTHDERGYPVPPARWCPACAAVRLASLEAENDPRNAADIASLRQAIARFEVVA